MREIIYVGWREKKEEERLDNAISKIETMIGRASLQISKTGNLSRRAQLEMYREGLKDALKVLKGETK